MLVACHQPPKILEPSEKAFDFPSAMVAAQRAAVLREILSVAAVRGDYGDTGLGEFLIQLVRIVGVVADQSLDRLGDEALCQRLVDQRYFMRRSTFRANGDRKTVAVRHCHDLGPLAALGFADAKAPLFAGAKVPSINASRTSKPPRVRRSSARASRMPRMTPERTQCWKRR